MKDLKDSRWIKFKGLLFLMVGLSASGLLLFEHREAKTAALLGIAVWCFCRFYYFAFYVIEHYVDPGYRFSGLGSFGRYWLSRQPDRKSAAQSAAPKGGPATAAGNSEVKEGPPSAG
jgi:hypothetical protein